MVRELSGKQLAVKVQHHADQDPASLREFWGQTLNVDPETVRLHAKSNSGKLRTRVWRCAHGVAAVDVYDTYFRARIDAWMKRVKEAWM